MLQARDMQVKDQEMRYSHQSSELERNRETIRILEEEDETIESSNQAVQRDLSETQDLVHQAKLSIQGLTRECAAKQTEVEKLKVMQGQITERLCSEQSRVRKHEDILFDRETSLKVRDGDYQARKQDLEAQLLKNQKDEDEMKARFQEIEALKRLS